MDAVVTWTYRHYNPIGPLLQVIPRNGVVVIVARNMNSIVLLTYVYRMYRPFLKLREIYTNQINVNKH